VPAGGSEFAGFENGTGSAETCSGTGPCTITLEGDSTVDAPFDLEPGQVAFEIHTNGGTGGGTIECDSGGGFESCKASYAESEVITLKATPDSHSLFESLSVTGSATTTCTGTVSECTVEIESSTVNATAAFGAVTVTNVSPNKGPT